MLYLSVTYVYLKHSSLLMFTNSEYFNLSLFTLSCKLRMKYYGLASSLLFFITSTQLVNCWLLSYNKIALSGGCLSLQQRHINTRHLLQQLDAVLSATICRLSQILCLTERGKHFSYFSVKTLVLSRCRLLQLLQAQICMWLKVFTSFLKVWQ